MGASAVEMSRCFPASLTARVGTQGGEGARIRIEGPRREAPRYFQFRVEDMFHTTEKSTPSCKKF